MEQVDIPNSIYIVSIFIAARRVMDYAMFYYSSFSSRFKLISETTPPMEKEFNGVNLCPAADVS